MEFILLLFDGWQVFVREAAAQAVLKSACAKVLFATDKSLVAMLLLELLDY